MNNKRIAIFGGGWIHNMGNAFLQLGAMAAIRRAKPDSIAYFLNGNNIDMPVRFRTTVFKKLGLNVFGDDLSRVHTNRLNVADYASPDYVVLSGSWLCDKYIKDFGDALRTFQKNGSKLIFCGVSGFDYDKNEINVARKLLTELKPYALISRDSTTFLNYADLFEKSYEGIDVGFFIDDYYRIMPPMKSGYNVYCFDKIAIPSELKVNDKTVIAHHSLEGVRQDSFRYPRTLWSELPDDYLAVYSHALEMHSDRVHACLPVLIFGGKAQMYCDTPRANLFKEVGCEGINKHLVSLNEKITKEKKEKQAIFLSELLK